ncbi:MAG: AmmeMemoRadiSam system radical SAM enzyme [Calditrichaeota bacterium]|nr:AmmeMemoRadiSam system radical SAM enzyme [Calditrichota bacterium]
MINRRTFLKNSACAACTFAGAGTLGLVQPLHVFAGPEKEDLLEARYYKKLEHRKIKCKLCPRECVIDDQERGYCGVRENRGGTYYTLIYGHPCTAHIDPIEKKPLFHFLPGTNAFSIATVGCNVLCKFCQNWEISQARPEQVQSFNLPPQNVGRSAKENQCASIAYTYTEPVIFTEYMHDTALHGREQGVKSVMISNGYIQAEPMKDLCKVLDAVKIDLKGYSERFYKELVSGKLKPVLDTLLLLKSEGMWTEIVYLVIPGQNDDKTELANLSKWIYNELGTDTPIHFTRFYPQFRLKNLPPTPIKTLQNARRIALDAGLHYVYTGNVPGDPGENTYCPSCNTLLIRRIGYSVVEINIKNAKCPKCHQKIAGVWE